MMAWGLCGKTSLEFVAVADERDQLPQLPDHMPVLLIDSQHADLMSGKISMDGLTGVPYPAVQRKEELRVLRQLCAAVPMGGHVVEVGSHIGGCTMVMAEAADPSVTIHAMEHRWKLELADKKQNMFVIWEHERVFRATFDLDAHWHTGNLAYATQLLAPWPNVRLIPAEVPYDCQDWQQPIDLMFEDSTHKNPQLRDTLDFFLPFVRSGGVIAGHDYHNPAYPDVKTETARLAHKLGAKLVTASDKRCGVWWLIKP
jgi:Methyltransferase domain